MSSGRVPGHGLSRGAPVTILIDGVASEAYEGESVSAAVMADRGLGLRSTAKGEPRGYYCGMGACFDCIMVVDGVPNTRTCVTWVRDGMTVEHQAGSGRPTDARPSPSRIRKSEGNAVTATETCRASPGNPYPRS